MNAPKVLKDQFEFKSKIDAKQSFVIKIPEEVPNQFNKELKKLRKKFQFAKSFTFGSLLVLMVIIRFASIACAYFKLGIDVVILVSATQFIVAPYSGFVSFALLAAYVPTFYIPILISSLMLKSLCHIIGLVFMIEISYTFITILVLFDLLLCFYTSYQKNAMGVTKWWLHFVYGFFNCKTGFILYMLLIHETEFNVFVLLLDYMFGITKKLSFYFQKNMASWTFMFYSQHLMGHLPRVYEQAHKFHHYLHGTNAFDAHIYGCGMPEEWCYLMIHLILSLVFGCPPVELNPCLMQFSYDSKIGHTHWENDTTGKNWHADHHIYHTKHFGIYGPCLDMLMDTCVKNNENIYGGFKISKTIENRFVVLNFDSVGNDKNTFHFS